MAPFYVVLYSEGEVSVLLLFIPVIQLCLQVHFVVLDKMDEVVVSSNASSPFFLLNGC